MWTERKQYLTQFIEISDYLKKHGFFHDFLIGSFSYDSEQKSILLTIEEDFTSTDNSNSPALVWDLKCEGVHDFLMEDMDGLSKWWISEILMDDDDIQFQLVNGYFSFKMESASLGIPQEINQNSVPKVSSLHIDYLIQEFKAGMNVDETSFSFEKDNQDFIRYIGYSENDPLPYWAGLCDLPDGRRFQTADELFEAKIYDGKSLKERWDEVTIYSINSLPLDDWLSCLPHSVETTVYEPEDDYALYVNGVKLEGFIDEDSICKTCGANQCYLDDYDEYFCPYCNLWMYKDFWDSDETHYFKKRPLEPELLWKPSKELNFCNVRFFPNDKEYVYYCPDESIEKFDWIEVPVGNKSHLKEAQVTEVFKRQANKPPFPLEKIKKVERKLSTINEKILETQNSLLSEGVICDLSEAKNIVNSKQAYDILKTPIGNFWLELNGSPIKISIGSHYPNNDDEYYVEASYYIKPLNPDFETFKSLTICSDIDLRSSRLIDNLGGEHKEGYNWQVDNIDLGIVAHPYSYLEEEVSETPVGLPYYAEWIEKYKELYGFTVAWKYFVSDEDLSVWFNT
ncbi:hypothetical protein [Streptococcus parasanguinis]|mgnify:FL=1|uniref:hypothetical protein n=1 Tax=Streptococcus parasanguinis TaxID=1318 RepID=UPI0012BCAABF|nr:hypothetical protein [Streptococcus parasanguinis]MTR98666.1 hypothetical protein [Streptococcus parasanguinis]MTS10435.1 hypothetical protein [Streptococcus parasanguinis]